MSEYLIQGETLAAIGDAIRAKDGSTAQIAPGDMPGKIAAIETGGETALIERLSGTMTTYSSDDLVELAEYGFAYLHNLTSVSLPNVTIIPRGCFYMCDSLVSINFPRLKSIGSLSFRYCAFTEFITGESFDSRIDGGVFQDCPNLQKVDFYHINSLGITGNALNSKNLGTVIIRQTDSVPPLRTNAFGDNPDAKMNTGEGYIYVPASMVDAYKAATNWSAFADQIRAIEDYPEIVG